MPNAAVRRAIAMRRASDNFQLTVTALEKLEALGRSPVTLTPRLVAEVTGRFDAREVVPSEVLSALADAGLVIVARQTWDALWEPEDDHPIVTVDDLVIDRNRHEVWRGEQECNLTPTEWMILNVLLSAPNLAIPSTAILTRIWGPSYVNDAHLLRVNMSRLRRNIRDRDQRIIKTRPAYGYMIIIPDATVVTLHPDDRAFPPLDRAALPRGIDPGRPIASPSQQPALVAGGEV